MVRIFLSSGAAYHVWLAACDDCDECMLANSLNAPAEPTRDIALDTLLLLACNRGLVSVVTGFSSLVLMPSHNV
jgi:hypothetical protein